jgi:hypothetical protein
MQELDMADVRIDTFRTGAVDAEETVQAMHIPTATMATGPTREDALRMLRWLLTPGRGR